MPVLTDQPTRPASKSSEEAQIPIKITPELVTAVADKVYAMLLHDLRLEFERQRWMRKSPARGIGGKL
jgi:hypothetical protein